MTSNTKTRRQSWPRGIPSVADATWRYGVVRHSLCFGNHGNENPSPYLSQLELDLKRYQSGSASYPSEFNVPHPHCVVTLIALAGLGHNFIMILYWILYKMSINACKQQYTQLPTGTACMKHRQCAPLKNYELENRSPLNLGCVYLQGGNIYKL